MANNQAEWQVTAAAYLLEARKTNGRLGSHKSRSGCTTCKIRRVKCDEAQPSCNRCNSTGRKCDGYAKPSQKLKGARTPPARGLVVGKSHIGSQLFALSSLRASDRRAFDFFLSWTAPRLAGSLDKDFWCGSVLQLAQSEPFVLDSLLAISTLYEHPQYLTSFKGGDAIRQPIGDGMKTPTLQTGHPANPPPLDQHHATALKAYNRAIQGFRRKVDAGRATPSLALLSCMLFVCIEIIRDDVFSALALLTKATELLKRFGDIKLVGQERQLYAAMELNFTRLGVLAAAFGHPHPVDKPPELVVNGQQRVFADLADARTSLYAIMADMLPFIGDAARYKASLNVDAGNGEPRTKTDVPFGDDRAGPNELRGKVLDTPSRATHVTVYMQSESLDGVIHMEGVAEDPQDCYEKNDSENCEDPAESLSFMYLKSRKDAISLRRENEKQSRSISDVHENQRQLELRLGQWYDAFQGGDCETAAARSLVMYYHVTYLWIATRLSSLQTVFDEHTHRFEQVIHHAEFYVNAKALEEPTFTFEVGAVPPLYAVASKCRIPSLRRKALQLLARAPRKECMWGATSIGQLSARLIAIEEEGLGLPVPKWNGENEDATLPVTDSIMPSEEKRVHNLELMKNTTTNCFEVRVTRFCEADGHLRKTVQDYPI